MKPVFLLCLLLVTLVCGVPAPDREARPDVNGPLGGPEEPSRVPLAGGARAPSVTEANTDEGRIPQFSDACDCSTQNNPCSGNIGTKNLTCDSGNKYIQCTAAVCAVQTCPDNRVWNETTKVCTECPATGFHISTDKQFCACNEGTTFDFDERKCVSCPVNATILPDECFCPKDLPLSEAKDSCLPCPAEAKAEEFGCECNNVSLFWNNAERSCKPCPGEWKTPSGAAVKSGEVDGALCQCPGTNDIFDLLTVTCTTCPPSSVAVKAIRKELPDFCRCLITGQMVDEKSKVCECHDGKEVDKARNLCVPTSGAAAPPAAVVPS